MAQVPACHLRDISALCMQPQGPPVLEVMALETHMLCDASFSKSGKSGISFFPQFLHQQIFASFSRCFHSYFKCRILQGGSSISTLSLTMIFTSPKRQLAFNLAVVLDYYMHRENY